MAINADNLVELVLVMLGRSELVGQMALSTNITRLRTRDEFK